MTLPAGVAAVWPFPPDWSRPIKQGREFKTDILISRDGTEQRLSQRAKPREMLGYQVLIDGGDSADFAYQLWALQPHVMMMPLWPRRRRLTAAVNMDSTTLVLDKPAGADIRNGDEWILFSATDYEVVTIVSTSVDRKTLNLSSGLTKDWPIYSAIYPAWRVQFDADIRSSKLTSSVMRAPLQFRRLVDDRAQGAWDASADQTLGSLEVLTRQFNWARPMQIEHNWLPQFIDAGIGPFSSETDGDIPKPIYKGELLLEGRDEIDWWLAFFDRVRGRQVPFLMPTWQDDLQLQQPISASDFEVPGTALGLYQMDSPIHTHIMLRKKNGSLAFFTVQSIAPDGGYGITTITTDEAWDETYGTEECPFSCFMMTVRLASDALEVEWITDEVAKVTLAVQTVEVAA